MKYRDYVNTEEACQVILDYINKKEFYDVIDSKDRAAFISGLGVACGLIIARCNKYLAEINEK